MTPKKVKVGSLVRPRAWIAGQRVGAIGLVLNDDPLWHQQRKVYWFNLKKITWEREDWLEVIA